MYQVCAESFSNSPETATTATRVPAARTIELRRRQLPAGVDSDGKHHTKKEPNNEIELRDERTQIWKHVVVSTLSITHQSGSGIRKNSPRSYARSGISGEIHYQNITTHSNTDCNHSPTIAGRQSSIDTGSSESAVLKEVPTSATETLRHRSLKTPSPAGTIHRGWR